VDTICNSCHILYEMVYYISNDILQPLKENISNWKWHCEIWRSHSCGDENLSLLYTKICRLVNIYQLFGRTCCIHFQDIPTMKMKTENFTDTPISNNRQSVLPESLKTALFDRSILKKFDNHKHYRTSKKKFLAYVQ
jgi:hypothetical protein